jgi:uncharacterized protein (TIGR02145 family)
VGIFYGNEISFNTINASNSSAHSCGAENVHNPNLDYGTMTDQDGNTYKTIVIGNQEWMAENLKVSHYRNGDLIANVTNNVQWASLTTGAWASYNNDSQFDCPYGKLYNGFSVTDQRNVCPVGWHVPADGEWTTLTDYLGGEDVAGGKMKSTGTQYWISPNANATNESGFSGLPCGGRGDDGGFDSVGNDGYLWSSSESWPPTVWFRYLGFNNGNAGRDGNFCQLGYSVRCIKD